MAINLSPCAINLAVPDTIEDQDDFGEIQMLGGK